MRLLAMDTAGTTGIVALAHRDADGSLAVLNSTLLPGREFSSRLVPAIAEMLQENHLALADLDAFAVVRGPGSFTGLRVGLSAVKGMAEALDKPVIALSRLAVMAAAALERAPDARQIACVLDAGRGEYYLGLYRHAGWECISESLETAASLREALGIASRNGGCIVAEKSVVTATAELAGAIVVESTLEPMLTLAARCWREERFADVATLDANYLRRSDAELFARPQVPHLVPALG
jgi:tRNA threonylcarbamoyladenosine biosynthesis protein TsaB